jgi:outer membrane protein insertion porin family
MHPPRQPDELRANIGGKARSSWRFKLRLAAGVRKECGLNRAPVSARAYLVSVLNHGMKRLATPPALFAALLAIASFSLAWTALAQPKPKPETKAEAPATPPPPPEPEPEPQLEPEAKAPEATSPEPEAASQPEAASEPDLPARAAAPTISVPRTVCEGRRIQAVEVSGNGRVSADDVRASLKLKKGMTCTDSAIARDARGLWELGYFDDLIFSARVDGNELVLLVIVKERPAIGKISFEGDDEIDEEDIDEKVSLEVGAVLSENDVRAQIPKIRDVYAEEGYFLAKVSYRLIAMANNQVEVRFEIVEGPEVSVRRIQFVGNDHLGDDELLGFMRTHPTGFFSMISSNDTFKRDFFDEDVLRIQALYYDRGYLNVQVAPPRIELTPDRQQIDITVPVQEGPRFKIGRLRVIEYGESGSEIDPLGGRRTVREKIDANPGEWFSRTKLSEGIEEITRHYRDESFAKAEVTPETELDVEGKLVHVTVSIRRGPSCHIERIEVQGNDKTRDRVLRREILIVEGAKYSQSLLERSKERMTALGYFERVDMSEADGSEPDGLVITYEVKERPTGTFQVGAGFSSIEQFILTAQIDQQNLFGHGQSLSLQAQISGIRQLAQIQFVEPYLLSSLWSLSIDASRTSNSFAALTTKQTGGGIAFGHPVFDRNLRLALRYSADYTEVGASTGGVFGASAFGAQGALFQQPTFLADIQRGGFTSSLRLSLTYDSRDNRMFPTKGIYASFSSEAADPYLGSQRTFFRNRYFGRFYYPLFLGMVLRINTEAGLVTSRKSQGVPLYERFFLGGILSVRGFPYNGLGPRGFVPPDPNPGSFNTDLRLGGNAMLRANVEIEFPIVSSVGIKGVVFTDAGNVWNLEKKWCQIPSYENDDTRQVCGFNKLRYSAGFGVRWFSPMGPLRFEWGFPFNPKSYDRDMRFDFTIGQFF